MKKLLSIVAAAGMLLGGAAVASAAQPTDVKVKGQFDFGFGLYDGTGHMKHSADENFDAIQRFRAQVDFIASESLKGVAYFEIGNINWGSGGGSTWSGKGAGAGNGNGGAMGADGVSVEVKNLYIDWLVPQTDLQVRMGIQSFALPRAVARADGQDGGVILDDDLAGVLLSYNFNENVGINAGWFRPWDGTPDSSDQRGHSSGSSFGNGRDDEVDVFALTLPIEVKNAFSFTPYGMYALIGSLDGVQANLPGDYAPRVLSANSQLGENGQAWWAGFAFDLSYFNPFVADVDFMYGSYSSDDVDLTKGVGAIRNYQNNDRDGWVALGKFGYKLDHFTPIAFGWYGSGADSQDNRDGLMPFLSSDFGLTSFGWSNAHFGGREGIVSADLTPVGTWAVGLGLEDIKFVEGLTSQFRVAYFQGTSNTNSDAIGNVIPNAYTEHGLLGPQDCGIEVNLDNVYKIYENLDLFVELGYINMDLKHEPDDFQSNSWKGYVGFTYSF